MITGGRILGTLAVMWAVLAGCDRTGKKPVDIARDYDAAQECFLYVHGRDSIKLSMVARNGVVEGRMAYLFYEKDKSMGTIEGQVHGDTLLVDYKFTAEGMFSIRELAFLRSSDRLLMGTGEILNHGNRDVFKNPAEIEFSESIVLKKISCEKMGEAVVL